MSFELSTRRNSTSVGWLLPQLTLADGGVEFRPNPHGTGYASDVRALRERWADLHPWIPANAWVAAAAALATTVAFKLVGPLRDPSDFYAIAAQVIPAFLIALAVERSLLDSLGTKADFARARRDEFVDSYVPPGLNDGILNTFELTLHERTKVAVEEERYADMTIPVSEKDVVAAAVTAMPHDDRMTWRLLRSRLHDEFGLPEDDPDFFEKDEEWIDPRPGFAALKESILSPEPGRTIRWLAVLAARRAGADLAHGKVQMQTVLAELKRLHGAYEKSEIETLLQRITYRANIAYEKQRKRRTLSVRMSIVLLTATELLALIGVMSPGRPYEGLFLASAALVVASIMNVAGGALADLAASREASASDTT